MKIWIREKKYYILIVTFQFWPKPLKRWVEMQVGCSPKTHFCLCKLCSLINLTFQLTFFGNLVEFCGLQASGQFGVLLHCQKSPGLKCREGWQHTGGYLWNLAEWTWFVLLVDTELLFSLKFSTTSPPVLGAPHQHNGARVGTEPTKHLPLPHGWACCGQWRAYPATCGDSWFVSGGCSQPGNSEGPLRKAMWPGRIWAVGIKVAWVNSGAQMGDTPGTTLRAHWLHTSAAWSCGWDLALSWEAAALRPQQTAFAPIPSCTCKSISQVGHGTVQFWKRELK